MGPEFGARKRKEFATRALRLGWLASLCAIPSLASASTGLSLASPSDGFAANGTASLLLRVTHSGSPASNARLRLASPAGVQSISWACAAFQGASCAHAEGAGALDESLAGMVDKGILEYRLQFKLASTPPPIVDVRAELHGSAVLSCADGQTTACATTLKLPAGPLLNLDIEAAQFAASVGQSVRYSVNLGATAPRRATAGTRVRVPIPAGLRDMRWTCNGNAGACAAASGSGAIEQILGDFGDSTVRFDIQANVAAGAPATIAPVAVAIPPRGGYCAGAASVGTGLDAGACSARTSIGTIARIHASRTATTYPVAGGIAYRIIAENRGAAAPGSRISMQKPEFIKSMNWKCTAERGAVCPQASGSGALAQTIATWPAGGVLNYDFAFDRALSGADEFTVTPTVAALCGDAELAPPCSANQSATPRHGLLALAVSADQLSAGADQAVGISLDVSNRSATESANDLVVDLPVPAGIRSFDGWTCTSSDSGASCPLSSGKGALRARVPSLGAGVSLQYRINATTTGKPPRMIKAAATVSAPAAESIGCATANGRVQACQAEAEITTVPVIALEQRAAPNAGNGAVSYQLDVFNAGADGSNVRISDAMPAGLAGATWTCTGIGTDCPAASGSGAVKATVANMPAGSGLRYQVAGRLQDPTTASVNNILTALPAPSGRCHHSAEDALTGTPCANEAEIGVGPLLSLTQSAVERQLLRGGLVHYELRLGNRGQNASQVALNVDLPAGVERIDWECKGFEGARCPHASGSGAIAEVIANLPMNGVLVYAIRAELGADGGDRIVNVARVAAGSAACVGGSCESSLALPLVDAPKAHVQMEVRSDSPALSPGQLSSWTIDVSNLGSELAREVRLQSKLDPAEGVIESWTCDGAACPAASGSGAIDQVISRLPVLDEATAASGGMQDRTVYHVKARVAQDATQVRLGMEADVANATCNPVDCSASHRNAVRPNGAPFVILNLFSNDSVAEPNGTVTFEFDISNYGGSVATNFGVSTINPPDVVSSTWTCTAVGGSVCPAASGSGPVSGNMTVTLDGGLVSFSVVAQLDGDLPPTIDFSGAVSVQDGGACDPSSCIDTLTLPTSPVASLTLTSTDSEIYPDSTVTYSFRLENTGGDLETPLLVSDIVPPDFLNLFWSCTTTGGASCGGSGVESLEDVVIGLAPGASVTYTVDALAASTLAPLIDYTVGVGNLGQINAPDGSNGNPPPFGLLCIPSDCSVTSSLPSGTPPPLNVSISKTADRAILEPGGNVRYTIDVAASGTFGAENVQIIDSIPPGLSAFTWTCSASGDISCPASSGTGSIDLLFTFMPPGSSVRVVVDATVAADASGSVLNRAQVFAEDIVCSPSSCQAVNILPVQSTSNLVVTKTSVPASGTLVVTGQPITWNLNVSNDGGPTLAPLTLRDTLPTTVSGISVDAPQGVSCNSLAPDPGTTLTCTVGSGFSGELAIQISATVAASAPATISNTVVASGSDGPDCASCSVSNPVGSSFDVALANVRPFSAGGVAGYLVDIVNTSSTVTGGINLGVSPANGIALLGAYSSGCTAVVQANGSIAVSCPNPPSAQGISCGSSSCTLTSLPANAAATVFVAPNAATSLTVTANAPGDSNTANNSVNLPAGGTP